MGQGGYIERIESSVDQYLGRESSVREGLGTALEAQKHTSSTVISGNASSRTVGYINKGEQKVYIKTILLFQFASISEGIPSSSS